MVDPLFATLERRPAYRVVEDEIRRRILDGVLAPGAMLPPEHDLADQLGVTRPTVREALRSVESAGLLERGPRRRMVVKAPDRSVVTSAMHEAVVLHGVTYRELWEVGATLEPASARLAAAQIGPELLEELRANLERTAAVLDDPLELGRADIEFHDLVAQGSGNRALLLARETQAPLLRTTYTRDLDKVGLGPGRLAPDDPRVGAHRRLLESHTRIVDALERGDAEAAHSEMSEHFDEFRRGCERAGLDFDTPVSGTRPTPALREGP